jgi:hypothetical protein
MKRRGPSELQRKQFAREFGFSPITGEGALQATQRILERQIVENGLADVWRIISEVEQQLSLREPLAWMRRREVPRLMDRGELKKSLKRWRSYYRIVQNLARAYGLHPEQA